MLYNYITTFLSLGYILTHPLWLDFKKIATTHSKMKKSVCRESNHKNLDLDKIDIRIMRTWIKTKAIIDVLPGIIKIKKYAWIE